MLEKPDLFNFNTREMAEFFKNSGEKAFRAQQVMAWLHQKGVCDFEQMTNLAKSLRVFLKENARATPLPLLNIEESGDGTIKFLWDIAGQAIESVFIPEENRATLCISTQIGCALECAFCCTGKQGFSRNLTTAEIVGQLWGVKTFLNDFQNRRISNVVLMGMGEPLANFENTAKAIDVFLDDFAYGLSRRRVTVSTAGIVPMMDKLAQRAPVALAVSLHAARDDLRDLLVPLNKKYPLKELLLACKRYLAFAPRDFITFEYTLIHSINDSTKDAQDLLKLTRNIPCKFNLIAFNPFEASNFIAPSARRLAAFADVLRNAGRVVTFRKTRGDDIAAACGQLAGKVQSRRKVVLALAS